MSESFQADVILLRDHNLLSFLIKILLLYGTDMFSYAPGIIIMIIGTINVLKFRTLVACLKGLDKQDRPRSDCLEAV